MARRAVWFEDGGWAALDSKAETKRMADGPLFPSQGEWAHSESPSSP
jgi:hypothetical protein